MHDSILMQMKLFFFQYVYIYRVVKFDLFLIFHKQAAWQMIDREILDLLPKTKEAKYVARLMDRDSLTFDVALQRTEDNMGIPKVYISV